MKFAPTPPGISESLALGLAELGSVLAAYIFGSRARGTERPSSDVDIAVLLEPPADMQGVGAVLRVCQDTLGRDDVDMNAFVQAAQDDAKLMMNNSDVKLKQRHPVQRQAYAGRQRGLGWGTLRY